MFAGSSVKDIGITELMDASSSFSPPPSTMSPSTGPNEDRRGPPIGIVFKSLNDPFSGQLTFIRTVSGVFKSDTDVFNLSRSGAKERFGTLLFMNGKSQTPVKEVGPGAIFAVAKLKDTHIGDTISAVQTETPLPGIVFPDAVMSYAVTAAKSGDDEKISAGLAKIRECDPTVRLRRDEVTHEFLLSGMGDQHLAIVAKRLKDQFKVEAVLDTPRVPYRETITAPGEGHYRHKKQTGGAGQFRRSFSASRRTKPAMNSPTT
ncbi:MAG: EF-Tu/IF-2/RF-3 family GTPase [Victivallis sp.]